MNAITLNVRGLNNHNKRQIIFHWLEVNKYDVIFLQETFCIPDKECVLFNDWNGQSHHTFSNSSHSKGVSILFGKEFNHKLISTHNSDDSRKLLLNIEHNGQTYTLVSLYAPTEASYRRDFFIKTKYWIKEKSLNPNCLIIGGDFNCSLTNHDRKIANFDRSRASLKDFISYLDIHDSYRELNKSKSSFTYSNANGSIQSRIDYIFTSSYCKNLRKNVLFSPPLKYLIIKQ